MIPTALPARTSSLFLPALCLVGFFVGMGASLPASMLQPLMDVFNTTFMGVSQLITSYLLAFAIAALLLGYGCDRVQRRKLLVPGLGLFCASTLALLVAPTLEIAITLRVVAGVAAAVIIPSALAVVTDEVAPGRHVGALGLVMFAMSVGSSLGPGLGGMLMDIQGWQAPLLLVAAGCALAALLAGRYVPARALPARQPQSPLGWAVLRPLFAKGAWCGIGVAGLSLSGVVLRERYGLSFSAAGASSTIYVGGMAVGYLAAGLVRRFLNRDEDLMLLAVLLLAAAMLAFALAPLPLPMAQACLAVWGAALGLGAPAATAVLADRAGQGKGMVLAFAEMFNVLAMAVALPMAFSLMSASGPKAAMGALLAVVAAGAWLVVLDWAATRGAKAQAAPMV